MLIGLIFLSMMVGVSVTWIVELWLPLGFFGSAFVYGASGAAFMSVASLCQSLSGQSESDADELYEELERNTAVSG